RSRHSNGLNLPTLPEAAVEALDVLDHLEALRLWHVAEAWHDAVTPQADRHRAAAAAYTLGHGAGQVRRRRQLPRGRRPELELRAGEVAGLRRLPRRQHRAHGPVALAVAAVAMADSTCSRVDFFAAGDHSGVRPDAQRHVDVRVLGRGRNVSVSARLFVLVLVPVGAAGRRVSEPEPEEQYERGERQRYEKLGSHVGHSSEVPVDTDEDLVPPVAQRTLFDEAPKIHAVPDEEGDVLPGIELRLHGKHGPVALLVLEATRPELVETTRYDDLLLHEVVGLNAETGRSAVEVAAQLARQ